MADGEVNLLEEEATLVTNLVPGAMLKAQTALLFLTFEADNPTSHNNKTRVGYLVIYMVAWLRCYFVLGKMEREGEHKSTHFHLTKIIWIRFDTIYLCNVLPCSFHFFVRRLIYTNVMPTFCLSLFAFNNVEGSLSFKIVSFILRFST